MATTTPAGLIDRLRATALDLVSLVAGADAGSLRRVPAEGEWSAATVVSHLADTELIYSVRARLMLTSDRPWLAAFDEQLWAERFGPLDRNVRDALQRWRALRDANVRLFGSLSEEEWGRQGVHEERGAITVTGLAEVMVAHDRNHLGQIRRALSEQR
ncbi:MAG: DinB family protein [Acidimicrobiales bacterium]